MKIRKKINAGLPNPACISTNSAIKNTPPFPNNTYATYYDRALYIVTIRRHDFTLNISNLAVLIPGAKLSINE